MLDVMPFTPDISLEAILKKTLLAFTSRDAETSETPEFIELKTRRYRARVGDVYDKTIELVGRWFGWRIVSREKNLGGMAALKCNIVSLALGANTIDLSVWFLEELSPDGSVVTVVNAKASAQTPTKGDLGEARRNIAFLLGTLDDELQQLPLVQMSDGAQARSTQSVADEPPKPVASAPAPVRKPIMITGSKLGSIPIKQSAPPTPASENTAESAPE